MASSSGAHEFDRAGGGVIAERGGRDDDRVAALDRHHRLVDGGGAGIGRGRDGRDDAHGLGVFDDALGRVFLDDADRFGAHEIAQRAEGLPLLLDDLVGNIAEAGIRDRQFRKLARMLRIVDRPGQRPHRLVGALLGCRRECRLRGARPGDQRRRARKRLPAPLAARLRSWRRRPHYAAFGFDLGDARATRSAPSNGSRSTRAVRAIITADMGRVKNTVQSLLKLIIELRNDSSASGPRMTPSTIGAIGKFSRSKI